MDRTSDINALALRLYLRWYGAVAAEVVTTENARHAAQEAFDVAAVFFEVLDDAQPEKEDAA